MENNQEENKLATKENAANRQNNQTEETEVKQDMEQQKLKDIDVPTEPADQKVNTTDTESQKAFSPAPKKSETIEDTREKLKDFADYLSKIESYEDKNTLNLLKCIGRYYWDFKSRRLEIASMMVELKYPELLKDILVYANGVGVFKSDAIWFPTYFALSVIWNFTDASKELSKRLIEVGFVKYFAANLKHEPYMDNLSNKNVAYVIKSSLSTMQNCVRHVPNDPAYEEEGLKETLKPYLSSENDMFKTLTIMILSNILSEDENSKLEDTGSIPFMVKCLNKAMSSLKKRFSGFAILELLEAIARIAVNDVNKLKLVEADVLPVLVQIMETGLPEEQKMAAKVIWNLCFDENVKQKVVDQPGCLDALEKLSSGDSPAKQSAKGALWKISGEKKHQKDHKDEETAGDKHIFISYQHSHQKMVLKIKDRLKNQGYKVWIDTEQMGGSTLEAMALAVENAMVVLVCASEKYKLSPNCRTEAEYTFQIKKPIVPLMLQRYYKPDGWLGMLFGAKMYVNFDGKYEFDMAYQLLMKEMHNYLQDSKTGQDLETVDGAGMIHPSVASDLRFSPPMPKLEEREPSAMHWDNGQIMEWASKQHLNDLFATNSKLEKLIQSMTGRLLVRFCKLKKEAPEFFYKQLCDQYELDMLTILQLTDAMDVIW